MAAIDALHRAFDRATVLADGEAVDACIILLDAVQSYLRSEGRLGDDVQPQAPVGPMRQHAPDPMPQRIRKLYEEADLYREIIADEFATPTQKAAARRELVDVETALAANHA